MVRSSWLAAVALALGVAGTARAEVVATFLGTSPSQDVNVAGTNASGTRAFQSPVGPFNFLVQSNTSNLQLGQTFTSFCADYFQDVALGNTYTYSTAPFTSLPDINGDPVKAQKVQELFDRFYDLSTNGSAENGAAFQLALWEILYDPTKNDLSSGNFTATDPGGATGVAVGQSMLDIINDPRYADPVHEYDLFGLISPTAQDQILVQRPVPGPAGVVLLVIGAGALIARRKFAGKKDAPATEEVAAA